MATRCTISMRLDGEFGPLFCSGCNPPGTRPSEQQGRIQIGTGTDQSHEPANPPRDHHEQREGEFQTFHHAQLQGQPFLRIWKKNSISQAPGTSRPQFHRGFEGGNRPIAQQPTFHRLHTLGSSLFLRQQVTHFKPTTVAVGNRDLLGTVTVPQVLGSVPAWKASQIGCRRALHWPVYPSRVGHSGFIRLRPRPVMRCPLKSGSMVSSRHSKTGCDRMRFLALCQCGARMAAHAMPSCARNPLTSRVSAHLPHAYGTLSNGSVAIHCANGTIRLSRRRSPRSIALNSSSTELSRPSSISLKSACYGQVLKLCVMICVKVTLQYTMHILSHGLSRLRIRAAGELACG